MDQAGLEAHLANLQATAAADAAVHRVGRGGLCEACGDPWECGSHRLIERARRGAEVYAERNGLN